MTRGVTHREGGLTMTAQAIGSRGRVGTLLIALIVVSAWMVGATSAQTAEEEGTASFYSDKFVGKKTASGEAYDKDAMAASHKTYAFGTKVKVTNLANGKSAVVTINDRMAKSNKMLIEVTPHAAEMLGFMKAGKAKVKVEPAQ